jgi:hypothetical protein
MFDPDEPKPKCFCQFRDGKRVSVCRRHAREAWEARRNRQTGKTAWSIVKEVSKNLGCNPLAVCDPGMTVDAQRFALVIEENEV